MGNSGPSALGRREAPTLIGAVKMCRCLLFSTISRKPRITPTCSHRPMVSSQALVTGPKGARTWATAWETNPPVMPAASASPAYSSRLILAPRYRAKVAITMRIIPSTSHAPEVCEP